MKKFNWLKRRRPAWPKDKDKFEPEPDRDWRRLISVWLIGVALLFAGAAVVLPRFARWAKERGPAAPPAIVLDGAVIERVLQAAEQRAADFAALEAAPPVLIDPGL